MITDNYIKMCEKAKEIQCERILGRYNFGDLYYLESVFRHGGKFRYIGSYDGYENDREFIEISTWLPTQEQLQEMVDVGLTRYEYWIRELYHFVLNYPFEPASMNELWLSFVMKEKYHKVWDGEDWRKS